MPEMTQFELSRVYAKGWSAGRASHLDPGGDALDAEIDALNPYKIIEERNRWTAGYKDGLRRAEELDGRGQR